MSQLNFSHSRSLFSPLSVQPLVVIGVGSVGGQVVSNAAKAGVRDITVYDPKCVSSHNLPMSRYEIDHIGHPKVAMLADIVRRESGIDIKTHHRAYEGEPFKGAVIVSVDSLATRLKIFHGLRERKSAYNRIFIDTRIHEKYLSVHMVDIHNDAMAASYLKLFPNTSAPPQLCGRHGFITVTQIAAAVAVEFLTGAWTSGTVSEEHYSVLVSDIAKTITVDGDKQPETGEDDDVR